MEKIRIGLVGIGYLGSIHLELLLSQEQFELVGVYDRNKERCSRISEKYPLLPLFDSYAQLLSEVQAVGIIASTPAHFELALLALKAQKAVFIEKPLCQTLQEAAALEMAQAEALLPFQVGHVERFNPAFVAFESFNLEESILHFSASRCAPFQERGADVSVVLDLLIHDLDLLLSLSSGPVTHVEVQAKQLQSAHPDEVRVKLAFEDGLRAHLFVSRIAEQRIRQVNIETQTRFFELDLLHKTLKSTHTGSAAAQFHTVPDHNALRQQWQDFARAVQHMQQPKVNLKSGLNALDLALHIDAQARDFISEKNQQIHNNQSH